MTNNPDQIRADIETTRAELGSDVDALAEKVTPSKIAHRQMNRLSNAIGSMRERVMGSADDASQSAAEAVGAAKEKVTGNPLAVGLIALGVGWLAASLIPATEAEKSMASGVKDAAQPLMHEATDAAKEVAGKMKEPAQEAAQSVKDTARDAAGEVRGEATQAAHDVKDHTQDAAAEVRDL
jgi:ElaB/YqjD/DUF883 family membrane-anchored ribosome-binding protein